MKIFHDCITKLKQSFVNNGYLIYNGYWINNGLTKQPPSAALPSPSGEASPSAAFMLIKKIGVPSAVVKKENNNNNWRQ